MFIFSQKCLLKMISKAKIKFIRSLQQKKYRDKEKLFLVEGLKIVKELLIHQPSSCEELYLVNNLDTSTSAELNSFQNKQFISENELKQISALKTPPGVLAIVKYPAISAPELTRDISLALDKIQDPGNLGTIIRIADWFGVKNIVCSEDTVDCYNPKVVQSTMGAIFRSRIYYTDLKNIIQENRSHVTSYATSLSGENVYETTLNKPAIILMGNESNGLSDGLIQLAEKKIKIPSFAQGDMGSESLNVSVATGIICSEFRRRLI